jgi:hypothetical protein
MAIVLPPRARRTLTWASKLAIGDALGTYYFVFKDQLAPQQLD